MDDAPTREQLKFMADAFRAAARAFPVFQAYAETVAAEIEKGSRAGLEHYNTFRTLREAIEEREALAAAMKPFTPDF